MLFGELTKLFYRNVPAAEVLVGEIQEISGPESSVAEVETTPLGATYKRFRPSKVVESGTVNFKVFYDPNNPTHSAIRALATTTPAVRVWAVEYSDTTRDTFDGFVTSCNISGGEQESEVMMEIEIRITGLIDTAV